MGWKIGLQWSEDEVYHLPTVRCQSTRNPIEITILYYNRTNLNRHVPSYSASTYILPRLTAYPRFAPQHCRDQEWDRYCARCFPQQHRRVPDNHRVKSQATFGEGNPNGQPTSFSVCRPSSRKNDYFRKNSLPSSVRAKTQRNFYIELLCDVVTLVFPQNRYP